MSRRGLLVVSGQASQRIIAAIAVLCVVLVAAGLLWRSVIYPEGGLLSTPSEKVRQILPTLHHPFIEAIKLVVSFFIGAVLTAVHKSTRGGDAALSRSMEHAQILLCVSGALMMIIIGDSLARAFGIAGAASIIRFRTPVEDPKDTIILFLMLGLGMACGLGAFALAGMGTAFLSATLYYLGTTAEELLTMSLTVGAEGVFPATHVDQVLARHHLQFEARERNDGPVATVRYRVRMKRGTSLDEITADLKSSSAELTSVVWETKKKKD